MSWSIKLGRIAGIPIFVHWTFLILIAYYVSVGWSHSHNVAATAMSVAFVLALFGCVVLHELGHALTAARFGVPTADITLLPIGGVARLQRMPERPAEELLVALAGPAVNVAIVAILLLIGVRWPSTMPEDSVRGGPFLPGLLVVNCFLVAFNMLPAFPMDGGRVLRALLAMATDYGRATRIAASIGQFMAILFGFWGLTSGAPMLLLIALFVWIGAGGEANQVAERLQLSGLPVRAAMLTDFQTLRPDQPLSHAVELLLAGAQQDFPVIADGQPFGVLTRAGLLDALARLGRDAPVGEAPLHDLGTVEAGSMLAPALARLREGEGPCLQVIEAGRPVGLLTTENIGELLMVRAALNESAQRFGIDGGRVG